MPKPPEPATRKPANSESVNGYRYSGVVAEDRRATLIALPEADGALRFDVRMQGDQETVFFDL
jgi:protocatechuate 3,4-dioxygenase alpha subunit